MENSSIEWTDHTFNPWTGCAKVSPGCAHCYAEGWAKRSGIVEWGPGKPRRRSSEAKWREPLKWNVQGEAAGIRYRVFCASLADWLDDEVPIEWLCDLFHLIATTPHLDWLLLTKRPQNFRKRVREALHWLMVHAMDLDLANSMVKLNPGFSHCTPVMEKSYAERQAYVTARYLGFSLVCNWLATEASEGDHDIPPDNVWIGTTVEDQQRANERVPLLLNIPARVRFLSCEPLLGPVELTDVVIDDGLPGEWHVDFLDNEGLDAEDDPDFGGNTIDWVICGGESGPGARPMHPLWAKSLRDQCAAAGTPFLFKQWGEWTSAIHGGGTQPVWQWEDHGQPYQWMRKIGKKAAGRMLDGITHDAFPTPTP